VSIYVDSWASSYNTAYLATPEEGVEAVGELAEDGSTLRAHSPQADAEMMRRALAFVDGVRRVDAVLYQDDSSGGVVRGIAGTHACGAVVVELGERPGYGRCSTNPMVIWGSGAAGNLPDTGWWRWRSLSTAGSDPDAPLTRLQSEMRHAEQDLARSLFDQGYLTVLDGPLNNLRSLGDAHLVGYVKTHKNTLLPVEQHRLIPGLSGGQRTSLFRLGVERYSCYLRLVERGPTDHPWAGIVRLEMPVDAGQAAAVRLADELSVILPRFAGVAHRDPRAPQNLQPVGALEKHLRRLMGDAGLAVRAVREAAAAISDHTMTAAPAGTTD
jgi:hypothetical protein